MKARKFLSLALTGVLAASLLAGCGTDNNAEQGNNNAGGDTEKKLTIGMVTDVGGVHDNSFNQAAWEGLTRAKNELGVTPKVSESKRAEDYTPNLNGYVKDKNVNMTWGIGFLMEKDIKTVATANPDAKIGIIDSDLGGDIPKNVTAVTFKEEEGSFLMGVMAGKMTKSNKIGFVGGVKFALIEKFEYGFKAGVKSVNPNATVTAVYADAFDKPDKGKLLAAQLYQQGADIIFHASGLTGDGVFAEAKERGAGYWVIGVDRDQSELAPANTLSSMVKRVDNAIFAITKDLNEGKYEGGHIVYGLAEDGVGYAPTTKNNVPEDVIKLMDDYKQQIIDKKITVPATADAFNNFK
ncbi:BMP family ABC transporter substrate-binding protein [Tumebacillus avium]|uniref:BMP family ABC transporter substrate-binding protein n=1 Tax=Tumebacillus avium TaxID=1903704 RepID=A0A1Y0IT09_9BACL|nr:BMP family ABC transporter substrate-binding protein [Tumebacillus avium]ARU62523.1 BMP family ABC transporter substrate-binding protein [Tumebacillus avium]